jgi:hydrogenase maturation protease
VKVVGTIAVIGCGNANRSDDGAGPAVLRALHARGVARPGIRLLDAGTDGMAVMFAARGCDTLILIDACRTGSAPGAVFEVPGTELARDYSPSLNLHDFRFEHALAAGHRLFGEQFPRDVMVLLIEAAGVAFGNELSAPVADAVEKVALRVVELIGARQGSGQAAA